jgi:imidazole glycerol-phosphate synthase subunit HisH
MKLVGLVDYGSGNLGSLQSVFEKLGIHTEVIRSPEGIARPDLLVLPGVGAAGQAVQRLERSGMAAMIRSRLATHQPVLGICLGAQLLCRHLREGDCEGFGHIHVNVEPFSDYPFYNNGWCRLDLDSLQSMGLARALKPSSTFYFNHRYYMGRDTTTQCVSIKGHPEIPAIYLDQKVCAIQLHPEKSQRDGLILLRNIIEDHYGL